MKTVTFHQYLGITDNSLRIRNYADSMLMHLLLRDKDEIGYKDFEDSTLGYIATEMIFNGEEPAPFTKDETLEYMLRSCFNIRSLENSVKQYIRGNLAQTLMLTTQFARAV